MYERFAHTAADPFEAAQSIGPDPDSAIEAAFIPVDAPAPSEVPAEPSADGTGLHALSELIRALASRLHLQDVSMDDLLVLGILFLILRKNAEWDVLLIMGILFFLGLFDETKT